MEGNFDPRVHAYRDDLADEGLKGHVTADAYAEGALRQFTMPVIDFHSEPDKGSGRTTQALMGEVVRVFDEKNGWAWGQLQTDGYVGYFAAGALASTIFDPTHEVASTGTFLYASPNIKSPLAAWVSYGSRLNVTGEDGDFLRLADGRFVYGRHMRAIDASRPFILDEIKKFVGVPYLWGGRSSAGIDCSSLMQLACAAAGINAPRDSDMQESYLGTPLDHMDMSRLRAGDMVFWKGHAALMIDDQNIIHCNGFHMQTVIEPVNEAIGRIAYLYAQPTSFRRLDTF